ncbi:MAG: hypothetical protein ABSH36_04045 [Solirubrobacteraceae bacterium]
MPRYRMVLAGLSVAIALAGLASASASAHEFIVEEKSLATTEELTGTIGASKLEFKLAGEDTTIECKSGSLKGGIRNTGAMETNLKLSECQIVTWPPVCRAITEPNVWLSDELTTFEEKPGLRFSGLEGKEFLFEFRGTSKECTIKPTFPVDGSFTCELPEIKTEAVTHEVACKPAGDKLSVGPNVATFTATAKARLASGKKWSVD